MQRRVLDDLLHFLRWWFVYVPAWWARFLSRLLIYIDNQLAVSLMARLWFTPAFQDTTLIGRSISFLFRTFRVALGVVVLVIVAISVLLLLLLWIVSPGLIVIYYPIGVWLLIGMWVVDIGLIQYEKAQDPVRQAVELAWADGGRLKEKIVSHPKNKHLLWLIEKNESQVPDSHIKITDLITLAGIEREFFNNKKLETEHLLLAWLKKVNYHYGEARAAYAWEKKKNHWRRPPWIWEDDYPIRPIGGVNRGWTGVATPILNRFSTDLTQKAARGQLPELIGHKKKVEEIVRVLGQRGRENVLVVGKPGSGKTTLIDGLAYEIIRGTKHESLRFKRLLMLDIAALTAGDQALVKKRLKVIIDEIIAAGNIILFVDEIHNLLSGERGDTPSIVFSALQPHLELGELQFIGTTTPQDHKQYIESHPTFARAFRVINLPVATAEQTEDILERKAFELEEIHRISITYRALESAVALAQRFIHDRVLPDSAIDILEEVATKAAGRKVTVTTNEVMKLVTEKTSIPIAIADSQKEKQILLDLEKELHTRVIGQNEAVSGVAAAMRRARTGLAEEGRLLASFLFAGATGVGKTETAKTLASVYFGSEKSLVRLDMSEYQSPESINRLIGPPPGQPGFEQGGQLTESIRRHPFAVILLDEIEKADPRILDVFLQLLDDARLTDGAGNTVDFANTILIATTNVGTKSLQLEEKHGGSHEEIKATVMEEMQSRFRPEFLNRFTDVIVFQPLNKAEMLEITDLLLSRLRNKMAENEITIEYSRDLKDYISQKGFSPKWGARELRRVIFHEIEEGIAQKMLEGKMVAGGKYTITKDFLSISSYVS